MDVNQGVVFERADVNRRHGDLLPRTSGETKWVATDLETDCRGVGEFEQAARTNLVYAVEAYHQDTEGAVPYVSTGKQRTCEMRWLRDEESSITDHLEVLLPFRD